jgi:hypothetical protein
MTMGSICARVVLLVAAVLATPGHAQQELPPPGPGEERVVFRNELTRAEKHFALTSGATFGWRGSYRSSIRQAIAERDLYWAEADLDGDGKAERILIIAGAGECGSIGCTTLILTAPRLKWRLLGNVSAEPGYLFVLDKADYGWRRLRYAVQERYWTGCEYWSDAYPEEAEGGPNVCDKIEYGAGFKLPVRK